MKIAVVDNLPVGGAKRVVYEQCRYLSADHKIDLYTNEWIDAYPLLKVSNQARVYRFNPTRRHGLARILTEGEFIWSTMKKYWEVAQRINRSEAEVVLVHPCMITEAPVLIPWLTKPTIYFAHEWLRIYYEPEFHRIDNLGWLKKNYERARRQVIASIDKTSVRAATKVITTSLFNHQNIKKAYDVDAEVIPLGVDTAVFKPDTKVKRSHFLLVGNKDDLDGYDLLQAATQATSAKFKLKIAGTDGKTYDANDAQMCRLYQEAVATVCLHHLEPFGLAPIESMACGTPVIAVDEGGYKETVINGETGWLIKREVPALLTAINKLARDENLYRKMSQKARQRVVEDFTWERHGKRLENSLREGING